MINKQIHINQHVIRSNKKNGANEPVVTVKTYKSNDYGHEVNITGSSKVIYSAANPLPCGAKVWIETKSSVEVKNTLTGITKVV
jgi:hypothetical protein